MKTNPLRLTWASLFIISSGTMVLSQIGLAQCPEVCGDNFNTAFGVFLSNNTTGGENTVMGAEAFFLNKTGSQNTVVGALAAFGLNGSNNVAIGDKALTNTVEGDKNTAVGYAALSYCSGDNNIGIGVVGGVKLTTGSRNIEIGNQGVADDERTIRLGDIKTQRHAFIAGIRGATAPDGVIVMIGSDGRLGTMTSSARYKEAIKPMAKSSEAVLSLKPVSFRYKHDLDPQGIPQFGLVAEDVAKVDSDLVARDESGKPYTVRYEAVNAMLLNEFLKEHRKVEALAAKVDRLEKALTSQTSPTR